MQDTTDAGIVEAALLAAAQKRSAEQEAKRVEAERELEARKARGREEDRAAYAFEQWLSAELNTRLGAMLGTELALSWELEHSSENYPKITLGDPPSIASLSHHGPTFRAQLEDVTVYGSLGHQIRLGQDLTATAGTFTLREPLPHWDSYERRNAIPFHDLASFGEAVRRCREIEAKHAHEEYLRSRPQPRRSWWSRLLDVLLERP